jgi:putative transposase
MARPPRIFVENIPVHVTIRGNDRQDIFRAADDRAFFRSCLHSAAHHHNVAIHAYVLMTNHVHLLVTGNGPDSLPRAVQSVGRRYVVYFNERYARTGTLWEGRYHACLVQADRHLLACHRYVDLNPVRAGLVASPEEYIWSSHRFHARGYPDDLVTAHAVILELSDKSAARQAAYRALFDEPLDAASIHRIRHAVATQRPLGDDAFLTGLGFQSG